MTAEQRAALRIVAEGLPAGTIVPTTREQVLAMLALTETDQASASPATPERLLSVDEVSQRLGIGRQWLYRNAKQIGGVKIGRSLKFNERDVRRFVERHSLRRLAMEGR